MKFQGFRVSGQQPAAIRSKRIRFLASGLNSKSSFGWFRCDGGLQNCLMSEAGGIPQLQPTTGLPYTALL